jgi:hypothetical protein
MGRAILGNSTDAQNVPRREPARGLLLDRVEVGRGKHGERAQILNEQKKFDTRELEVIQSAQSRRFHSVQAFGKDKEIHAEAREDRRFIAISPDCRPGVVE